MAVLMKKGFRLMKNPNPSSRISCSAYGCDMKCGTNAFSEIKMFTFPRDPIRRRRWELATRRANWKAHSEARLCSKHFITGRPSRDPNNPDYVPSIFVFNKIVPNVKNPSRKVKTKPRRKLLADESSGSSASFNSSLHEDADNPTSSESVSSAFKQSLKPLNRTLTQMMVKLTDMEEERDQLRQELVMCRREIHQLREAHQDCTTNSPSTSMHSRRNKSVSVPSTSSVDVTDILKSVYSDDPVDVYERDSYPSQYLEQVCHQSGAANKGKRRSKKKQPKETDSDDDLYQSPKRSKKKQPKETDSDYELYQSPKKRRVKSSSLKTKGLSEISTANEIELPFQNGMYHCPFCEFTRPYRSHVKLHLYKHISPYKCLMCTRAVFTTKERLKAHLMKKHILGTSL